MNTRLTLNDVYTSLALLIFNRLLVPSNKRQINNKLKENSMNFDESDSKIQQNAKRRRVDYGNIETEPVAYGLDENGTESNVFNNGAETVETESFDNSDAESEIVNNDESEATTVKSESFWNSDAENECVSCGEETSMNTSDSNRRTKLQSRSNRSKSPFEGEAVAGAISQPKPNQRTTKLSDGTKDRLKNAWIAVKDGRMSMYRAAKEFNVSASTLWKWCKRYDVDKEVPSTGRRCFLGKNLENQLKQWILEAAHSGEYTICKHIMFNLENLTSN